MTVKKHEDYTHFIVSVTSSHLADFEMRVMTPIKGLDLQILWLSRKHPTQHCAERVRVCKAILGEPEDKLPLLVLKIRFCFFSELRYCVDSAGQLPTTLWTVFRSIAAAWRADTQDIESINSLIKDRQGEISNSGKGIPGQHMFENVEVCHLCHFALISTQGRVVLGGASVPKLVPSNSVVDVFLFGASSFRVILWGTVVAVTFVEGRFFCASPPNKARMAFAWVRNLLNARALPRRQFAELQLFAYRCLMRAWATSRRWPWEREVAAFDGETCLSDLRLFWTQQWPMLLRSTAFSGTLQDSGHRHPLRIFSLHQVAHAGLMLAGIGWQGLPSLKMSLFQG